MRTDEQCRRPAFVCIWARLCCRASAGAVGGVSSVRKWTGFTVGASRRGSAELVAVGAKNSTSAELPGASSLPPTATRSAGAMPGAERASGGLSIHRRQRTPRLEHGPLFQSLRAGGALERPAQAWAPARSASSMSRLFPDLARYPVAGNRFDRCTTCWRRRRRAQRTGHPEAATTSSSLRTPPPGARSRRCTTGERRKGGIACCACRIRTSLIMQCVSTGMCFIAGAKLQQA